MGRADKERQAEASPEILYVRSREVKGALEGVITCFSILAYPDQGKTRRKRAEFVKCLEAWRHKRSGYNWEKIPEKYRKTVNRKIRGALNLKAAAA